MVTSVRGILIVAIYDKLQRLSVDALESGGAVTLMSTDVSGTEDIISLAYESWSCVIQIAFGIWVLHSFIGPACFLIIFPTLGNVIFNAESQHNTNSFQSYISWVYSDGQESFQSQGCVEFRNGASHRCDLKYARAVEKC